MEETISRIASSSSTTRMRTESAGMDFQVSVCPILPQPIGSDSNQQSPEKPWVTVADMIFKRRSLSIGIIMNASALSVWYALSSFAFSRRTAEESAALLMLAASLLVFRTFRERYLLLWIVGWAAYFSSSWTLHGGRVYFPARYLLGISHAEFVLAVCLFAAAICLYTHARDLLVPLLVIAISVMAFAFVRPLLWPDSITLRVALEVAYRIVLLAAAAQLLHFRWSRTDLGVGLLSASLVCLHLQWAPLHVYFPIGITVAADLLLGVSMLFIVFDDSRLQMRRLAVINSLTTSIARAQQHGPMMEAALGELKTLMGTDAAWFRLI